MHHPSALNVLHDSRSFGPFEYPMIVHWPQTIA